MIMIFVFFLLLNMGFVNLVYILIYSYGNFNPVMLSWSKIFLFEAKYLRNMLLRMGRTFKGIAPPEAKGKATRK